MSEQLSRAVAAELRRLLEERGISGNAVAKATGIPQSSVAAKLRGQAPFDLDDVQKVCRMLELSVADVVAWAESR